jgi:type VI protein secretion system component VasK
MNMITEVLILGVVTAVVSRTVTQENIFAWLRVWANRSWLKYLLSCQYCFSFWVAGGLVALSEPWQISDYVFEVLLVVAVANALMITYELATVKIKVQRTLDEFNRGQIETQRTLNEGHRLNNAYSALQLERMEINAEGARMLKAQADEHNAKVAVERAKTEVPKSFGGAN